MHIFLFHWIIVGLVIVVQSLTNNKYKPDFNARVANVEISY